MINLIKKGKYRLVVAKDGNRILYLGPQGYLWKQAKGIGDLLLFSKHPHKLDYVMAYGVYRLYEVQDEPRLVDLQHLELKAGKNKWQGYLLLTGLPRVNKARSRIIATGEVITKGRTIRKKKMYERDSKFVGASNN
jgi:hypothetical protein